MVEVMTRWARLVLATAAMILAGSGAPVVERMIRLVPMAMAVVLAAGAASIHRHRRGGWGVLRLRLEDVGDRWRALLLGAPPAPVVL